MKKIFLVLLILSLISIFLFLGIFVFKNNIKFYLNGSKYNTVLVNNSFNDEGIEAFLFNKDISDKVEIKTDLDVSKLGKYYIYYDLDILIKKYSLKREILVVDLEPPVIKLIGEEKVSLYVGESYLEEGVLALDNYDNDITENVVIEGNIDINNVGEYEIVYTVSDFSGNKSSAVRKVVVNKKAVTKPVVSNNIINNDNYNKNNPIIKYIEDNNYKISIGYYNLVNGNSIYYKSNKIYYGASLIKTLDALYLYDKNMVNDKLDLYIEKAISVSDNDAHSYLVNYIGKNNLKNYGIKLGAYNTLSDSGIYGNTTVMDQIVYLKKLYELTKNNSKLKSYFINSYGNYLMLNNVDVMHKYGYYGKYYHDVGIVLDEQPYIIVVLTEHAKDSKRNEIINNISKLVYEYHSK